ncbi:hypothetical protein AX16_001553 [Volvariella volvacea WC 439]|nr:hypothetical protein AX16_001553 [Volvariella volvacea WC 439]
MMLAFWTSALWLFATIEPPYYDTGSRNNPLKPIAVNYLCDAFRKDYTAPNSKNVAMALAIAASLPISDDQLASVCQSYQITRNLTITIIALLLFHTLVVFAVPIVDTYLLKKMVEADGKRYGSGRVHRRRHPATEQECFPLEVLKRVETNSALVDAGAEEQKQDKTVV